jgi:hypothetical protein
MSSLFDLAAAWRRYQTSTVLGSAVVLAACGGGEPIGLSGSAASTVDVPMAAASAAAAAVYQPPHIEYGAMAIERAASVSPAVDGAGLRLMLATPGRPGLESLRVASVRGAGYPGVPLAIEPPQIGAASALAGVRPGCASDTICEYRLARSGETASVYRVSLSDARLARLQVVDNRLQVVAHRYVLERPAMLGAALHRDGRLVNSVQIHYLGADEQEAPAAPSDTPTAAEAHPAAVFQPFAGYTLGAQVR